MIISYTVPEIWCVTNIIVIFHFGLLFALLRTPPPPPPPPKPKFKKNEKMPDMVCDGQADRWTDEQKK